MKYFADIVRLPGHWAQSVNLTISDDGFLAHVEPDIVHPTRGIRCGTVVPGMGNSHSHAFQRAMAGSTEIAVARQDDFWSWREAMYKVAGRITPEQMYVIAAQAYMEMLKAGYTSVAEFHYLHHQPDGQSYDNPAEMSEAIVAAANLTGINLTLLPVLYVTGGFDGQAPGQIQRRFVHQLDSYLELLQNLENHQNARVKLGIALHSLRAVPVSTVCDLLNCIADWENDPPIHIHIAEQASEVEDCLQTLNRRPIELLFDHCTVDEHWCLIHATHAAEHELQLMARSGCTVGLCPVTEANLGDGIFPLQTYLEADGSFCIGTDSNVSISTIDELRWLEYGQRLTRHERNIAGRAVRGHTGTTLWESAVIGGSRALGMDICGLQEGHRADFLVLDDKHPSMAGKTSSFVLDTLVFAGSQELIKDVICGGKRVVQDGKHHREEDISTRYRALMKGQLATTRGR